MFFHLLITPLVTLFNGIYNALPTWNLFLGNGYGDGGGDGGSLDRSLVHYTLRFLVPFDKYIPLHDGVLPVLGLTLAVFTSLLAFKAFKFALSLIPTVSAGG